MIYKEVINKEMLNLYMDLKKEELFSNYILAGGTALALQLKHRTSTDIDLFTTQEQSNREILNKISEKYGTFYIDRINSNFLELNVKNIRLDIGQYKQKILEMPKTEEGITFFGTKDIAAMKLQATLTRTKSRDFIDIAYLLNIYSLKEMFDMYKKKYNTNDINTLKLGLKRCRAIPDNEWKKDITMLRNDVIIKNIPDIIEREISKYESGYKNNILNLIKNKFSRK
jgi:predicted nucleotidyltransferase component of viral defense system